jgi:small multidrug resistance pump
MLTKNWKYLIFLLIGIIAETIATTSLIYTEEFTRIWPTLGVLLCDCIALFFLTICLRVIPVGIAYAIWSGIGIVFVAIMGFWFHHQILDIYAILGISLILAGVVIINLFSKSVSH